jgi:hypothetical protein
MPLKLTKKTINPDSTETYQGTVVNNTDQTITLTANSGGWNQPPPATIPAGQSGSVASSGDFANPAAGYVTYQYPNSGRPTLTVTFTVPSVGWNAIDWDASPPLQVVESGSTSGWNPSDTFTLTVG